LFFLILFFSVSNFIFKYILNSDCDDGEMCSVSSAFALCPLEVETLSKT